VICAVFDIDDTLYLERDYVRSGFEAVGEWIAKWFGIGAFGERCWDKFATGRRTSIFDSVLSDCGIRSTPELMSALVAIYRTHLPRITLAPDVLDVLNAAAPVAIISDGPMIAQSRKVEALRLSAYASPIVLTETLGPEFSKPRPAAFEYVMQQRPADAYVYIADNPLKDFTAPKQLGWYTVRIRRPGGLHYKLENPTATDLELTDCSGLPDFLNASASRRYEIQATSDASR
jgi:putative hydrolase of the HAD superfamily